MLKVSLRDQLLLDEMRRQIENDDQELGELLGHKNTLDNYKIDPMAYNKRLLRNFNKDHPLFTDAKYMHKRIMSEGFEILKNQELAPQKIKT